MAPRSKAASVAAKPKITGATSGVTAPGPAGKAAREAANRYAVPVLTGWRDPNANYADDDQSIDARLWRLARR